MDMRRRISISVCGIGIAILLLASYIAISALRYGGFSAGIAAILTQMNGVSIERPMDLETHETRVVVTFPVKHRVSAESLKRLADMPNVTKVVLHGVTEDPAMLRYLAECRSLVAVEIWGASDAHLAHVGALTGLESLSISFSPWITDEGVRALVKLEQLRQLVLRDTAMTDISIQRLSQLARLETLMVGQSRVPENEAQRVSRVTDASLIHLRSLRNLRSLSLTGCAITDAGCETLASNAELKRLCVSGTAIGDQGLKHLSNLRALESLMATKTRITPAGASWFRAEMEQRGSARLICDSAD
jgi:Leucine-rich repeat (LRR) protein